MSSSETRVTHIFVFNVRVIVVIDVGSGSQLSMTILVPLFLYSSLKFSLVLCEETFVSEHYIFKIVTYSVDNFIPV